MNYKTRYLALDSSGYEYERDARTVGELPHHMRRPALEAISEKLGVDRIQYGVSIYRTMGYSNKQIAEHGDDPLFHLAGDSMPLALLDAA